MPDYRALFDLSERIALVLGAASGIERASAEALGGLGAHVVCADRNLDGAKATAGAIRAAGSAEAMASDAADAGSVGALAAAISERHGRLDAALTTPGLNVRKRVRDYSEGEFERVVTLNLKGTFLFFRAFGELMRTQGSGSLIACSSIRASTIEPGLAVYGMTKAGIATLVKGFAAEIGPAGVRVNAMAPRIIETALTGQSRSARRSGAPTPLIRCSTAGAPPRKWWRRLRSSPPTPRAISPGRRR